MNGLSNTQLVLLGTSLLGGVAGIIGIAESPRLLDTLISRNAFINRNAASLPPFTSKVTSVPPAFICAMARSRCG